MENKRLHNNYDLIRLLAALSVIISHSYDILGVGVSDLLSRNTKDSIFFSDLGVWTFFIISGFLINQSFEHSVSVADYLWKRIIRIFPGLITVVLLAMFIAGPIVTEISLKEYFSSSELYRYGITATLINIYYTLPGVFLHHPLTFVNGSLWTLPYEFALYIMICFQFLLKKRLKRIYLILVLAVGLGLYFLKDRGVSIPIVWLSVHKLAFLSVFFVLGSVIYSFGLLDRIKKINTLLIVCLTLISLFFFPKEVFGFIFLPLCVFNLAFFKPEKINFISRYGDVSYGVYIYSFLIQQLIKHYFETNVITMVLATSVIAIILGYISWIWIEKPALKHKNLCSKKNRFMPIKS